MTEDGTSPRLPRTLSTLRANRLELLLLVASVTGKKNRGAVLVLILLYLHVNLTSFAAVAQKVCCCSVFSVGISLSLSLSFQLCFCLSVSSCLSVSFGKRISCSLGSLSVRYLCLSASLFSNVLCVSCLLDGELCSCSGRVSPLWSLFFSYRALSFILLFSLFLCCCIFCVVCIFFLSFSFFFPLDFSPVCFAGFLLFSLLLCSLSSSVFRSSLICLSSHAFVVSLFLSVVSPKLLTAFWCC